MQTEWESSFAFNQVESDKSPVIPSSNHVALRRPATMMIKKNQYLCRDPINPYMKSLSNRVDSFYAQNWNRNFIQASPEELADAGLFFTGRSDRVKCWYCNGGLQSWDYTDKPMEEHAKWYPQCEFVLQQKGEDYVQSIFNENPTLKRPRIRNGSLKFKPAERMMEADQSAPPSSPIDVTMTIVDEIGLLVESLMKDSEVVASVTKMGFEEELVRETLRNALTEDRSAKFESCFQLVEAVMEMESSST